MWFLFAQRAPENPLYALNPTFDPVEFPKPVAVGDTFEFNILGRVTKCIVIEVSKDATTLADLNRQLVARKCNAIDAVIIWTEDLKVQAPTLPKALTQ